LSGISIFGNQINLLSRSMDIRSKIHDTITSNIANINTPNYKCKNMDFQKEFNKYLENGHESLDLTVTNKRHFKISGKESDNSQEDIGGCENIVVGNDKNNVDIDKEMAKLSKNQLLYNVDSQILVKELKILKDVITQGGR